MAKSKKRKKSTKRVPASSAGSTTRSSQGTLRSCTVGALPILNRVLKRMRLEEILQAYLPAEDARTRPSTAKALLILTRNFLVSREPLYGIGEWAAGQAPELLGITAEEAARLNDDRMGRALDRLFFADISSLALALATHVVREFQLSLDELHNDSTTVTLHGAYTRADGRRFLGQPTLLITWGHNKDHRPDLKQLLFLLTVTNDGGVPVHFRAADGNTSDVSTHRDTWELLCQLAGRRDFLYVADCKLASSGNMNHIAQHGGKFLTVLPRGRSEDRTFRQQLREHPVAWQPVLDKTDACGELLDRYSVSPQAALTAEGFRLVWYHSTLKAEQDAAWRARQIQRTLKRLEELRRKLLLPRTRYRQETKVRQAVTAILDELDTEPWIQWKVLPKVTTRYRAERPGRPSAYTRFVRQYRRRFDLDYQVDHARLEEAAAGDGVFPLVTNEAELSPAELLAAYKRQPVIEKRFSQLKTDFDVAPVYLKGARRIEALLCVYFFAMMVEALLERELRQAMQREGLASLPMYPEGRPCHRPTTSRLLELFAAVQRHELAGRKGLPQKMTTELTPLQRRLLRLLRVPTTDYNR
jgi:transposase